MGQETASDLLARCATCRDERTWEEFLRRFHPALVTGVWRALRRAGVAARRDEIDDFLQEVYCRLLDNGGDTLRRFRGRREAAVLSYLARIAESVVIDRLRAEAASKRGGGLRVDAVGEGGRRTIEGAIDGALSPEELLLFKERRHEFLFRCRRDLGPRSSPRNLVILRLALFEGWTSREICERLPGGLAPSTVDSVLHRLKRRLERQGLTVPRRLP